MLCQALERLLRARGVQFVLGHSVTTLETRQQRVAAAHKATHAIEAAQFVLALGSDSTQLARAVGVRLPVYPIKGYSMTLDIAEVPEHAAPHINVTDISRKVMFARIGSRLRVAGMAELAGHDRSVRTQAINSLRHSTQALFPALQASPPYNPWAGLRPATPTGLPIVGVQTGGPDNLVVNTGHGALGLTLAFGTAQQVVNHLVTTPTP
jgi:D-amino-acid dehydrogenase